jgi:hypothetical protein
MAQLDRTAAGLNETTTELKTDVLALTRKIVSLEAEIDYCRANVTATDAVANRVCCNSRVPALPAFVAFSVLSSSSTVQIGTDRA